MRKIYLHVIKFPLFIAKQYSQFMLKKFCHRLFCNCHTIIGQNSPRQRCTCIILNVEMRYLGKSSSNIECRIIIICLHIIYFVQIITRDRKHDRIILVKILFNRKKKSYLFFSIVEICGTACTRTCWPRTTARAAWARYPPTRPWSAAPHPQVLRAPSSPQSLSPVASGSVPETPTPPHWAPQS